MSEIQKEALEKVVAALDALPEEHRAKAADAVVHDAQILCRGITIGAQKDK